ncbi:MAG: hypothetical protein QOE37_2240 [Microbacteriaceae bacterium]|nr:hypothetical protein [Microbacteriaceae bacterium]
MTASQPPQPPAGGQLPGPGTPPPYGQPPGAGQTGQAPPPPGFPAPGHGPQPLAGNQQPPGAPAGQFGAPAGAGFSMDVKKLRMADYVIAGGTVLYLILGVLPWVSLGSVFGFNIPGGDISGFSFSGMVSFAFVLFLLATAWAILPAFYSLDVGFPRSYVTVGLAGLGLVFTLFAWIRSLSYEFKIVPLLALLVAVAIAAFAVFTLLPELRNRPALPGGLAKAGQWANQRGPEFGQQPGSSAGHAAPPPVVPPQQYAPPPAPPAPSGGSSTPDAGATPGAAGPV